MRPDSLAVTQSLHEHETVELATDSIHLWFAFPHEITDPDLLARYAQWLSAEELAQQQRFYFAKHRHQYLITRALVRSTLSCYADVAPGDWRFSRNAYGKPEIMPGLTDMPIRFNLSHTDGLVVCAVVLQHDLGVDVEFRERASAAVNIAEHYFSAPEVEALYQLPYSEQKNRFFDYWTLKEAYIKAKGMGLSLPLDQFSFHLADNRPPVISFDDRLTDHPQHWQFWRIRPSEQHVAAVAVNAPTSRIFQMAIKKVVPLVGTTVFACEFL
ncbi:MAG: 4'-phosphopantetheinyl transferase superfamily protein [Methylovulum sp.]|nr:4'-phosphopantetheinyl transferase superfamily protein [Methylovulum sp.]